MENELVKLVRSLTDEEVEIIYEHLPELFEAMRKQAEQSRQEPTPQ